MLDDVNLDPLHTQVLAFMERYNYYNLIKSNIYFKDGGSCINLILYNGKCCFQNTSSFETGISCRHHSVFSMVKTTF